MRLEGLGIPGLAGCWDRSILGTEDTVKEFQGIFFLSCVLYFRPVVLVLREVSPQTRKRSEKIPPSRISGIGR